MLLLGVGLPLFLGHRNLSRLEKTWHTKIFDGREPFERFPARKTNSAAHEVELVAGRLGISFAIGQSSDPPEPPSEALQVWEAGKEPLKEWIQLQGAAERFDRGEVPSEVAVFFDSSWAAVDDLRDRLLGNDELPAWRFDLADGWKVTAPPLLGILQSHRVLVGAALVHLYRQDDAAAERYLMAASRLRRGTAQDPLLISQLVADSQLSEWLVARRALACPSRAWRDPLPTSRSRDAMLVGLRLEGWMAIYTMEQELTLEELEAFAGLPPFFRKLVVLHSAMATERVAARLEDADPSSVDARVVATEELESIPSWSLVSRLIFPNFADAWSKGARTELEVEHVLHVAELRRQLALEEMREPAAVPSRAIKGLTWKATPTSDGARLELAGSPPPTEAEQLLSLSFSVEPPSCALGSAEAGTGR